MGRSEIFQDADDISRIGATEASFLGKNTINQPDFDTSVIPSKPDVQDKSILHRSTITSQRNSQFLFSQNKQNLFNFESRLQSDLQTTTSSLINHMRDHSLLSNQNIPLMQPIENCLKDCFAKMQSLKIPENKNYFALSLKMFFMSLTEDELEFVCHNYVHNWINMELKRSNRLLSKYQVEDKLEYINQNKSHNGSNVSARGAGTSRTPREKSFNAFKSVGVDSG